MLYIEDPKRDLWPFVARTLASRERLDMVLCLYAGSGPEEFSDPFFASEFEEPLERVTTYSDGDAALCSERVEVDERLIAHLELHLDDLEEWGDSLILYRPDKYPLVAATIPHEGVILVADEFGSALAADGLRLSEEPPDWW